MPVSPILRLQRTCGSDLLPSHTEHLAEIATRTNVFNYISGFYFLASVFGSAVGSILLSNHVYVLNGLSISCYMITISVATLVSPACGRSNATGESAETSRIASEHDPLIPVTSPGQSNARCDSSKVSVSSNELFRSHVPVQLTLVHTSRLRFLDCCCARGKHPANPFWLFSRLQTPLSLSS